MWPFGFQVPTLPFTFSKVPNLKGRRLGPKVYSSLRTALGLPWELPLVRRLSRFAVWAWVVGSNPLQHFTVSSMLLGGVDNPGTAALFRDWDTYPVALGDLGHWLY